MRLILLLLITIISLITPLKSYSQSNPPDFERIEFETNDPTSQFYHPNLMSRYEALDTTLTLEQYYNLYYGFVFQSNYKPLLEDSASDSLTLLLSARSGSMPKKHMFNVVVNLTRQILSQNPFSLRDINARAFALDNLGETKQALLEMNKIDMIKQVIKSTGSGLNEKSPWYIVMPNNSYDILALDGYNATRKILVSSSVEFIQVINATDKKIKGFYFNYSQIYKRKPYYLKHKPRKMEINPLYNPNSKLNTLPPRK